MRFFGFWLIFFIEECLVILKLFKLVMVSVSLVVCMLFSEKFELNRWIIGLMVVDVLLFLVLDSKSVECFLMFCRFMLLFNVVLMICLVEVIESIILGFGLF